MKRASLFLVFVFFSSIAIAQNEEPAKTSDIYQIRLQGPIKCIQHIEYEETGEPIKGTLDEDGKTIYLEDYKVNKKVKVKVIFATGREEEILRSPCSVELSNKTIL